MFDLPRNLLIVQNGCKLVATRIGAGNNPLRTKKHPSLTQRRDKRQVR
jgi:hypothetical protein